MNDTNVSIIFTTYNSVDSLLKTLVSLEQQTVKNFEVVIADDGSTSQTQSAIDLYKAISNMTIKHVWQFDKGFRKTKILNKAIKASVGHYLIFTDGDCVLRNDFVAEHLRFSEEGYFLSGGYFKLSKDTSSQVTSKSIASQDAFDIDWLYARGLRKSHKDLKLTAKGGLARILNTLTPARASWNGHNSSAWRKDIINANGFDERMQYGGEDREFGIRLLNAGIKSKQIRYSAICLHMHHERDYVSRDMLKHNANIIIQTKAQKITSTPYGLKEYSV